MRKGFEKSQGMGDLLKYLQKARKYIFQSLWKSNTCNTADILVLDQWDPPLTSDLQKCKIIMCII